jgi:hypothetical protein
VDEAKLEKGIPRPKKPEIEDSDEVEQEAEDLNWVM